MFCRDVSFLNFLKHLVNLYDLVRSPIINSHPLSTNQSISTDDDQLDDQFNFFLIYMREEID